MAATVSENILGVGLYSTDEVARYARVSKKLVNRWFFGARDGDATVAPRLLGEGKFVPFLEFVQTMAIREIRQAHHVSLRKIRQLLEIAENEQGVGYPFARHGTTFLWGNELGLQLPNGTFVEASGPHRRSTLLRPVVVLYKHDLGYDTEGLANLYTAYRHEDVTVEMNPNIRFGEPIVKSCGYTAQALWDAATSEGSIEGAASAYGVDKKEVEAACRYFDHLRGSEAA